MDWGQVATGRLRGGPVGPSRSPARCAPRREAPASTIRRAPPRPCRVGSAARAARQGRFPHHVLDPDAPRAQQPVHGCPHRDAATAGGRPGGRRGAMDADRARGWTTGKRRPPAGPARRPHDWTAADRVGGLRGPSRPRSGPHRSSTPGGGRIAHRHARAYKLMIIESRPPGSALSPLRYPPPGERARPAPGDHRSRRAPPPRSTVLGRSRFPVLGRADGADPPLPQSQMTGQPSGQPAFQGPLFERSGQQATGPSDHRPHPNRSTRTSRPTPHRNATAPPHPRPYNQLPKKGTIHLFHAL